MSENNGQFKIDKDVPIPTKGDSGNAKYPWREMEVGNSFFVPGKTSKSFSAGVTAASKRVGGGIRFRTRTRVEDGVLGVRVWRVA